MKTVLPRLTDFPYFSSKKLDICKRKYAEQLLTILDPFLDQNEVDHINSEICVKTSLERKKEEISESFTFRIQTNQTIFSLQINFSNPEHPYSEPRFLEAFAISRGVHEKPIPIDEEHLDELVADKQRRVKIKASDVPSYFELEQLDKAGKILKLFKKIHFRPFPTIEVKKTATGHSTSIFLEKKDGQQYVPPTF
jgi:hypothetical protein